jgi:hypothetical protein
MLITRHYSKNVVNSAVEKALTLNRREKLKKVESKTE